jgi:hypothetical protein
MIRLTCLIKGRKSLSRSEFLVRWRDEVGPLVAGLQTGLDLVRYVQHHPDTGAADGDRIASELRGSPEFPFDAMADYWWPSPDALDRHCSTADGRTLLRQIKDAEQSLVDGAASQCWLTAEYPQVATGPARIVAKPRTPLLKLAFALMPAAGMSERDAQEYWLTRHGPLVRSHGVARGMTCYQQVHRRDIPLAGKVADAFGLGIGSFMGHAEAWFDRSITRTGPDIEIAKNLAAEDERNFIDLGRSFLFSGKEYAFVEREWAL